MLSWCESDRAALSAKHHPCSRAPGAGGRVERSDRGERERAVRRGTWAGGALKAGTQRADRMVEMQGDLLLTYADARTEDDEREVTARALRVSLGADYRPFERVSPFWFGSAESSLQQRIDRRYSTGAGAKLTLYREEEDDVSAGGDDQYPHCRHRHAARSLRQRSTVARRAQQSRRATAVRGTCIVLSDGAWHVPCTGDQSISSGRPSWQETAS